MRFISSIGVNISLVGLVLLLSSCLWGLVSTDRLIGGGGGGADFDVCLDVEIECIAVLPSA